MKSYIKPTIELVELSVKENIAVLPQMQDQIQGVSYEVTTINGISTGKTTYDLSSYAGSSMHSL